MAGVTKLTTGLTRLPVAKNPHKVLGVLYGKILRTLEKMPQDAAYRKYTEEVVRERTQIVKANKDVGEIEKRIGCGQIEEVIQQAENELVLARKMINWKPWEPLAKDAPPTQWVWPPAQLK